MLLFAGFWRVIETVEGEMDRVVATLRRVAKLLFVGLGDVDDAWLVGEVI